MSQTILITGADRRPGPGVARAWAAAGESVSATRRRSDARARLDATADEHDEGRLNGRRGRSFDADGAGIAW